VNLVPNTAIEALIKAHLGPDFHTGMIHCMVKSDKYAKLYTVEANFLIPFEIPGKPFDSLRDTPTSDLEFISFVVEEHMAKVFKSMPLFKHVTNNLEDRLKKSDEHCELIEKENARLQKYETYFNMQKEIMGVK